MKNKAYANELEIFLRTERKNMIELEEKPFETTLYFRGSERSRELKRELIMEIKYDPDQREFIEYSSIPEDIYIGYTEKIILTINKDYFEDLIKHGECVERFMHYGKLNIKLID